MIYMRQTIKTIFISTYVPQKCGIATFTKDVVNAFNLINPNYPAEIMTIVKPDENPKFPWEVKYRINAFNQESYLQAAEYINQSSCDVVIIEHEFGLYGGHCGNYLIPFLKHITKPKVITCHTIIEDSNCDYGQVLRETLKHVDSITVMIQSSADLLVDKYKIDPEKINVIPHGTPDFSFSSTLRYKKNKGLSNRLILSNINLLSPNKGIEYTLEAVAEIAKVYPNVLYLIIGQTHPKLLEVEGEKYRESLKKKIKDLKISHNVRFINKYISLDELTDWIKTTDYYITPYLDPQQSSSGALAYAVSAGKLCISTPYIYAKEVLSQNRGILVPFKDSHSIAQSIIDLQKKPNKKKKIEKEAYKYGRFTSWASVALQHLDLFAQLINEKKDTSSN